MENYELDEKITLLGQRISKLRRRKGLTVEKLAYESGVSKGNLSDLENGKVNPRFTTLLLLSEGLEVSLSALVKIY